MPTLSEIASPNCGMDPYRTCSPFSDYASTTPLPEYTEEDYMFWTNQQLAKITPPLTITDLTEPSMRNGIALGLLLQSVSGIKLGGLLLQPMTRVEKLHNVHEVFGNLRRLNVRLNNIQPEDIMLGEKTSIMQLLQTIASHFSGFNRIRRPSSPPPARMSIDFGTPKLIMGRASPVIPTSPRSTPVVQFADRTLINSPVPPIQKQQYTHIPNTAIGSTAFGRANRDSPSAYNRSTMTMQFGGHRSPMINRDLTPHGQLSPKPRTKSSTLQVSARSPISTVPSGYELPHYRESMNELASLKSQLNDLSKLISCESSRPVQEMSFRPHSLQTDRTKDPSSEYEQAQRQITELTQMLHSKDSLLRKIEEENMRLKEALRHLQEAVRIQSAESNNKYMANGRPSFDREEFENHQIDDQHQSYRTQYG